MNSKAISVLTEAGLAGVDAETSLRRMLSALASHAPDVCAAVSDLGLEIDDVDPAHERTVDIVRRLRDAGLSGERAAQIFGLDGAAAYRALTENLERFEDLEGR